LNQCPSIPRLNSLLIPRFRAFQAPERRTRLSPNAPHRIVLDVPQRRMASPISGVLGLNLRREIGRQSRLPEKSLTREGNWFVTKRSAARRGRILLFLLIRVHIDLRIDLLAVFLRSFRTRFTALAPALTRCALGQLDLELFRIERQEPLDPLWRLSGFGGLQPV